MDGQEQYILRYEVRPYCMVMVVKGWVAAKGVWLGYFGHFGDLPK